MTFDQTATLLRLAALVVILVPAVYNDLAFRKIPAWLVRTGFLTALVLSLLPMDRALFINHAGAFLAGGLIMYLFFLFGWVGAGDVKLFAGGYWSNAADASASTRIMPKTAPVARRTRHLAGRTSRIAAAPPK